jgi:ubiquinone/menaquinone biosynthesis C-methylase UbiE
VPEYTVPTWYEERVVPHYRVIAENLAALGHIQASEEVLEIGAGTGLLARIVLLENKNMTITDVNPEMLKVAMSALHDAVLPQPPAAIASADSLPFQDSCFDVVVSNLTPLQDSMKAVREAKRVLRPGGRLIAAMWGPSYSEMRINNRARRASGQPAAPYGGPRRAISRLQRSGFRTARVDRHFDVVHRDREEYLKYRQSFGDPPGWTKIQTEAYLAALEEILTKKFGNGPVRLDWNITFLVGQTIEKN